MVEDCCKLKSLDSYNFICIQQVKTLINPSQSNLNFIRKHSVPKFIQNGGIIKSSDITAATFCAFFKLGMQMMSAMIICSYERMDFEEGRRAIRTLTHAAS